MAGSRAETRDCAESWRKRDGTKSFMQINVQRNVLAAERKSTSDGRLEAGRRVSVQKVPRSSEEMMGSRRY